MQIFRHLPEPRLDLSHAPAALAIGNFDGVHLGHQAILQRLATVASEQKLACSLLTFEPHPREFFAPDKAPARLTSMREKLELFAEHHVAQAYVCHFDAAFAAMSAAEFIEQVLRRSLNVQSVLVGTDFRFGAGRSGCVDDIQRAGIAVESLPNVLLGGTRVSSTAVRQALAAGDLMRAKKLLGRDYSISGHVIHGDKVGRELGYPTANVQMQHDKPPLSGIYAVKLSGLQTGDLAGVASLGVRPTMKNNGAPTLEVHLFDFDQDIYGQHVRVHFLKKLRDEEKFPDLETLKHQIALDEKAAREYFVRTKSAHEDHATEPQ
jgi:riboflavin kinase/FMN adenylyltransferase